MTLRSLAAFNSCAVKQQIADRPFYADGTLVIPPDFRSTAALSGRAPRAGDAIGYALRDAYERDLGLPEDMAAMLRRLNRTSTSPGN
ncbi:MAG: hypothetical protein WDN24_15780 [Sphingomonas sp.]